jgi:hypothetical protein
MRLLPAALALLLALAPVAGAVDAPASTPVPSPGDLPEGTPAVDGDPTNRTVHVLDLAPSAVARSDIRERTVELGPALGFDVNATDRHVATAAMVRRINGSADAATRSERVADALDALERETSALQERQRAAVEAYAAGDVSTRAFLTTLGRLDAVARSLDERRRALATLADETPGVTADGRTAALSRELAALQGPVRQRAASVLRGRAAPTRFYAAVGNGTVVLSTVVGDRYLRESYSGDLRTRDGDISATAALDVTAASYPVVWETRRNNTQVVGSGDSYVVDVPHRQGHLTAFVDGGSRAVYREVQRRPVDTMGDGPAASSTRDGLRLRANRSYPGAPLRVVLTDAGSGRPLAANITIASAAEGDSALVGNTGSDGRLWTLAPAERFTVTAIRGNSVVFLTVDPTDPPLLGGNATGNDSAPALDEGS